MKAKKTVIITGGNSGIGLEAGKQLAKLGHHVVLLGRNESKGSQAQTLIRESGGSADFMVADLSTHAGVKSICESVASKYKEIHGLILGAGVLTTQDRRTEDGLHVVFATNYLSRYHMAQRLLPNLRAGKGAVTILVAGVPLKATIDFALFPMYEPFPGIAALSGIQIANHHYAMDLAAREPTLRVGVFNVGLVKTEILREMPVPVKAAFTVLSPVMTIPVSRSASNPVNFIVSEKISAPGKALYYHKPGNMHTGQELTLDAAATTAVVKASQELTGA